MGPSDPSLPRLATERTTPWHARRTGASRFNCFGSFSLDSSSPLQPRHQAAGVPAPAAHLLDLGIELVDQRGYRQVGAVAAGFRNADREVLAHPFHRKAEVELALVHGLVAVVHL